MAKKSRKEYTSHQQELLALRWEFLRRNSEYQDDIKRCRASAKENRNADPEEWQEHKRAWEWYFMEEYGIACPLDPKISFLGRSLPLTRAAGASRQRTSARRTFVKSSRDVADLSDLRVLYKGAYCLTPDCHVVKADQDGTITSRPLTAKEIERLDWIEVLVDLDTPTERITRDVRGIVARWRKMRVGVLSTPKKRARIEEYKRYLNVFNLRNRGVSWDDIARQIYSREVEDDELNDAKTKARRDYRRCKKLIEEGCRHLR